MLQVLPATSPTDGRGGSDRYQPLLDAFVHGLAAADYPSLTALVPRLTHYWHGPHSRRISSTACGRS